MGSSFVAIVATIGLLAVLMLGFGVTVHNQAQLTLKSQVILRSEGLRARTSISVTQLTTSGTTLTVTLLNAGSTDISGFSQMDVVVNYTQATGQGVTRLTYKAANPAAGQWTVQSISPQPVPGDWQPSASLVLTVVLPGAKSSGTGTIVIGTPNGVTTSAFF